MANRPAVQCPGTPEDTQGQRLPCYIWSMSRKRRSRDEEIRLEIERLDDALDELVDQLAATLPMGEDVPQVAALQLKIRREAAQAIAIVSERKATLLGLDANETAGSSKASGTLAELEQKLALAAKHGAS